MDIDLLTGIALFCVAVSAMSLWGVMAAVSLHIADGDRIQSIGYAVQLLLMLATLSVGASAFCFLRATLAGWIVFGVCAVIVIVELGTLIATSGNLTSRQDAEVGSDG